MKTYKPYLSLSKSSTKYELGVVVTALKNQTITSIHQEEIKQEYNTCWGIIITFSDTIQLVNGPESPIFSTTIDIALDKSASYKKIICSTWISSSGGKFGPSEGGSTSIDFDDII